MVAINYIEYITMPYHKPFCRSFDFLCNIHSKQLLYNSTLNLGHHCQDDVFVSKPHYLAHAFWLQAQKRLVLLMYLLNVDMFQVVV